MAELQRKVVDKELTAMHKGNVRGLLPPLHSPPSMFLDSLVRVRQVLHASSVAVVLPCLHRLAQVQACPA